MSALASLVHTRRVRRTQRHHLIFSLMSWEPRLLQDSRVRICQECNKMDGICRHRHILEQRLRELPPPSQVTHNQVPCAGHKNEERGGACMTIRSVCLMMLWDRTVTPLAPARSRHSYKTRKQTLTHELLSMTRMFTKRSCEPKWKRKRHVKQLRSKEGKWKTSGKRSDLRGNERNCIGNLWRMTVRERRNTQIIRMRRLRSHSVKLSKRNPEDSPIL